MGRRRRHNHRRSRNRGRALLWLLPFVSLGEVRVVNDDDNLIVEFSIVGGRLANVRIPS